jgi:putative hydrolase of the HAD superfamily
LRRFVVLDAMGVLYQHGNVVGSLLIPYLRTHGCTATEPGSASFTADARSARFRLISCGPASA